MLTVEEGIKVTVVDRRGVHWVISDPKRPQGQQVMLLKDGFTGGVGAVEASLRSTVTRYGVRRNGWRIPKGQGSFKVVLWATDECSMADVFRAWRNGWSLLEPVTVMVEWPDGGTYEAKVVATKLADMAHAPRGVRSMVDQVDWDLDDGHWLGPEQRKKGSFDVAVDGDLPPLLLLDWSGAPTSFTLPSGLTVNLGQGPGRRLINLDRGMQGQVTDGQGRVDSGTWSSLRGVLVGESLQPHTKYRFDLGTGLELIHRSRFLSPWR